MIRSGIALLALCYAAPAAAQDIEEITIQPAATIQVNEAVPGQNTISADNYEERLSVDLYNDEHGDGGETRVLIRFDDIEATIEELPRCATVQAARIEFFTKSYSPGPVAISPLTAAFDGDTNWRTAIGAVGKVESEHTEIEDEAPISFDVTASVQAIIDGGPNNGWVLTNESEDGWDFCSELDNCDDETAKKADKPQLVLTTWMPSRRYLFCPTPDPLPEAQPQVAAASSDRVYDQSYLDLARALEAGDVGTYTFMHPLLEMEMEREVKGVGHYVEEMPMGGEMEVHFEGARLEEFVAYLESVARTRTLEGDGGIVELHDGREIVNPLAQALQDGTGEVVITGYE